MAATDDEQLFGRDQILGRLTARLDEVEAGGFAIGLSGEPGVGKSVLQARVAEHAESRGFTVLRAHGSQSETHLPYAGLHQLLRPVLSHVDALPAQLAAVPPARAASRLETEQETKLMEGTQSF